MNNYSDSNIYAFNAARILDVYSAFVSGDVNCTLLAIGTEGPNDSVKNAVRKSAERLQYGLDACAWVQIKGDSAKLTSEDMLEIVEGIDPLAVIALDSESGSILSDAYGVEMPSDAIGRANGRTIISFANMSTLLETEEGKRKAWGLLKSIV